jgi:uncharacterized protein (TIGR03067 family)
MRPPVLLAALAALLSAADARDDAAKKELKKLEGTWVLVSGEVGKKLSAEHVKKGKIVWKGAEVTVHTPHQSKEPIKGTVKVDPTKSPREMSWVRRTGPHAARTMLAIYEFKGDDQYRVCFAPPGKARPRAFTTKAGSGHMLHVWKRLKK